MTGILRVHFHDAAPEDFRILTADFPAIQHAVRAGGEVRFSGDGLDWYFPAGMIRRVALHET